MTTSKRVFEFSDDHVDAVEAMDGLSDGRGWCNLTPEIGADDVTVLSPSVFALRTKQGAPVASFVTSPPKRGARRPSSLGILHTRGRLGKERIARLFDGAPFLVRQDHQTRGLLLDVPAETGSEVVLDAMRRLLESLCDYERTGRWRMEVFDRI